MSSLQEELGYIDGGFRLIVLLQRLHGSSTKNARQLLSKLRKAWGLDSPDPLQHGLAKFFGTDVPVLNSRDQLAWLARHTKPETWAGG